MQYEKVYVIRLIFSWLLSNGYSQPGTLDTSFGTNGKAEISFSGITTSLAIGREGKNNTGWRKWSFLIL
jgi:hypothetical protein